VVLHWLLVVDLTFHHPVKPVELCLTGRILPISRCYLLFHNSQFSSVVYYEFPKDPVIRGHYYKLCREYNKLRKTKYRQFKAEIINKLDSLYNKMTELCLTGRILPISRCYLLFHNSQFSSVVYYGALYRMPWWNPIWLMRSVWIPLWRFSASSCESSYCKWYCVNFEF
jgi:hypothetical protein